ncbi:hypothetical protein, partial [Enterococcus faecalis]|uniref:hypothetical protein n=1 Tax=Enterococcus faecalis TaxID=1351 RepID=UPI00403F898B
MVDAMRSLWLGAPAHNYVWEAIVWTIVIIGVFAPLAVARYLVVFLKRPGGQAQFSETLSLQAGDDRFGALHRWMGANLSRDLSLPLLAAQAGMSER